MKNTTLYILIAAVILIIAGGVWYHQKNSVSRPAITLGAAVIMSGEFATIGERTKDAMGMAIQDFKTAHPGVSVDIVYEDTRANPKDAVTAYRRLIDLNHVDGIVGPMLEIEMGALQPMIAKDNVPMFAISIMPPNVRGTSANPLMLWPDPTLEAEEMAQYVYNQGIRTVAVLGTQDTWESEVSDAFAKKFTSLGGTVLDKEITVPDSKDDRTTVTRALASKPQALFLGTYFKFFDWVKTARELGFKGKMYSLEIDASLALQAKDFANGAQFISPNVYANSFEQRFKTDFGIVPSIPDGQAYDATSLALKVLYENGNDRQKVLSAMAGITNYEGVSGHITFDHSRATFPLSVFEIQNGEIIKVN